MFDTNIFDKNELIIKKIQSEIEHHNKISYQRFDVPIVHVHIPFKQSEDVLIEELVKYYSAFISQYAYYEDISAMLLKYEYTIDDLVMHIDRSKPAIVNIMASLSKIRQTIVTQHGYLKQNLKTMDDGFINGFKKRVSEIIDPAEYIKMLFQCVNHKLATNKFSYSFLSVAVRIIEIIHQHFKLSDSVIDMIKKMNSDLKQALLHSESQSESGESYNRLQTFNVLPDERTNQPLSTIIHSLFGINTNAIDMTGNSISKLEKVMHLITADTGVSTGLIVLVSPNHDTYFDMSSLYTLKSNFGSRGVSKEMVDTFDLIRVGNKSSVKNSYMIPIAVNEDSTQMAYVLWTNDLKTFKYRCTPIHEATIKKILRRSASSTIEAYNKLMFQSINASRDQDMISFKRVKYMTFDKSVDEGSFINMLQDAIVNKIMKKLDSVDKSKHSYIIGDESFTDMILDVIEKHKSKMGVNLKLLSSHTNLIFSSVSLKIAARIKKELLSHHPIDRDIVVDSVQFAVRSNDNIYSKVIASHLLDVS